MRRAARLRACNPCAVRDKIRCAMSRGDVPFGGGVKLAWEKEFAPPGKRVVRNGVTDQRSRSERVQREKRDSCFPRILDLYVAAGSLVADVTFGKGVFWKKHPARQIPAHGERLESGVDCRDLPYGDGEVDCVVLDPPYMHSPGGTAYSSQQPYEDYYRNNGTGNQTGSKYHEAVLELYAEAGKEAYRVLRDRGVMIVKCQDEVCSNRQRFTHIEIIQEYENIGFIAEDLFVVMRNNRPGVSRTAKQVHARKNHSYFLVFWKRGESSRIWTPPE